MTMNQRVFKRMTDFINFFFFWIDYYLKFIIDIIIVLNVDIITIIIIIDWLFICKIYTVQYIYIK